MDALVDARKFIKSIPQPKPLPGEYQIQSPVYLRSAPTSPIRGLVVVARVPIRPPGTSSVRPSAALTWHGIRIRGLDYEIWHDNPDGSVVKGWHEHLWSPEEEDERVRTPGRIPNDLSLRGLFRWGLRRWGFIVEHEQLETKR